MQQVHFRDLGTMEYQEAWDYQEALLKENVDIKTRLRAAEADQGTEAAEVPAIPDTNHYLLLLEHPPVYTLGKSGKEENLLLSEDKLIEQGFAFFRINRGGDITYHGPGQLIGYLVLDLEKFYTDLGKFLRNLEEVIILTLAEYGVKGERSPGETGVWLDASVKGKERKICAMGIRCSRWITMHGFSFNINTDLSHFDNIIPCGIRDKQVTSLERELGRKVDMDEVKQRLKKNFESVFLAELTP